MQPIKKIRDRGLSIAIFQHDKNLSFSLQKSWKKKDSEEFESQTMILFEDDMLRLSELLRKAYNESIDLRGSPTQNKQQTESLSEAVEDEIPF